jgi:3-deoxy-D-manno-octulosonate 8-phosphate phosphatase (KDO 8-P phosphatase)
MARFRFIPALIIFDFDGVLTDNRVWVFEDGREAVACNRSDGLGFDALRRAKIPTLILSTECNPIVSARARKLKTPVLQSCADKKKAVVDYCSTRGISPKEVLYVGNDINDYEAMRIVGMPVCPADAHPRIKAISRIVLQRKGGAGVAREIVERLLRLS